MRHPEQKNEIAPADSPDFGNFNVIPRDVFRVLLFTHCTESLAAFINVNRSFHHLIDSEYKGLRAHYQKRFEGSPHILEALERSAGSHNWVDFHKRARYLPNKMLKGMFTNRREDKTEYLNSCNFEAFFGKVCVERECQNCRLSSEKSCSFSSLECLLLGVNSEVLHQHPEIKLLSRLKPWEEAREELKKKYLLDQDRDFNIEGYLPGQIRDFNMACTHYRLFKGKCERLMMLACFTQNITFILDLSNDFKFSSRNQLRVTLIIAALAGNRDAIAQIRPFLKGDENIDEDLQTAVLLQLLSNDNARPEEVLKTLKALVELKMRSEENNSNAISEVLNTYHFSREFFPTVPEECGKYLELLEFCPEGWRGTFLHYAAMNNNPAVLEVVLGYYQENRAFNLNLMASYGKNWYSQNLTQFSLMDCAVKFNRVANMFFLAQFMQLTPEHVRDISRKYESEFLVDPFFRELTNRKISLKTREEVLSIYLHVIRDQAEFNGPYTLSKHKIFSLIGVSIELDAKIERYKTSFEFRCGGDAAHTREIILIKKFILKIYLNLELQKNFETFFYAVLLGLSPDSELGALHLEACPETERAMLRTVFAERDLLIHWIKAQSLIKDVHSIAYIHSAYIYNANQPNSKLLPFLLQAMITISNSEKFLGMDCSSILLEAREALNCGDEQWNESLHNEFMKLDLIPCASLIALKQEIGEMPRRSWCIIA